MQKYYKNGKKFLTMLQDGTSQLLYPLQGSVACISPGLLLVLSLTKSTLLQPSSSLTVALSEEQQQFSLTQLLG